MHLKYENFPKPILKLVNYKMKKFLLAFTLNKIYAFKCGIYDCFNDLIN